jgi:hypothetical protein
MVVCTIANYTDALSLTIGTRLREARTLGTHPKRNQGHAGKLISAIKSYNKAVDEMERLLINYQRILAERGMQDDNPELNKIMAEFTKRAYVGIRFRDGQI